MRWADARVGLTSSRVPPTLATVSDPADLTSLRPRQAHGLSDETLEALNHLWTVVRAFSNTAHDVNNALQVIAGNAELLEARELDPAVRRRVEIVRTESGKAAATISRLLDFARGSRQPSQRFDLWPLVDAVVAMRLSSVGRGRITLTVDREGAQPAFIVGESFKVQQLLMDLLLTAEDRVAGRAKARITVSVTREGRGVSVAIRSSSEAADVDGPDTSDALPAPDGLTRDAQLWAAAYLAALDGGVLTVDGGLLTVSWPDA